VKIYLISSAKCRSMKKTGIGWRASVDLEGVDETHRVMPARPPMGRVARGAGNQTYVLGPRILIAATDELSIELGAPGAILRGPVKKAAAE
jgi:hypothetical protein